MQYLYPEKSKQLFNSQADSLIQLQIEVDSQGFEWVAYILWVCFVFLFQRESDSTAVHICWMLERLLSLDIHQ